MKKNQRWESAARSGQEKKKETKEEIFNRVGIGSRRGNCKKKNQLMGGRLLRIAKETSWGKKELPQPRLERGSLALRSGRLES